MKQQHITSWLDEQIKNCILSIDQDNNLTKQIKLLDHLISIRKKYEKGLDDLELKIRVMEKFILFITKKYKKDVPKLKQICDHFLEESIKSHE
ncbi:MAG: hypothetical protein ACRCV0_00850 [Brevinema sp.]